MKKPLTIFMWGYWGWGNHTPQLVKAVDTVEKARGFKPPVFVDIQIRREVRAQGFSGGAFESVVGKRRYKWMKELGNEAILTHERKIRIRRPLAADDLLSEAVELAKDKQRLIFYCACEFPCACHRRIVARLVLKHARKREIRVEVVEWPGGTPLELEVTVPAEDYKKAGKDPKTIPLGDGKPLAISAGVPWGSIAWVQSAADDVPVLLPIGPAKCRANDDWYLPVLDVTIPAGSNLAKVKRKMKRFRKQFGFETRNEPLRVRADTSSGVEA